MAQLRRLFFIDAQTVEYLRLTGRDKAQVALVDTYAKQAGLWADTLDGAQYARLLHFDLSSVARTMAGPSSPHHQLPTSALTERGIAGGLAQARAEKPPGICPMAQSSLRQSPHAPIPLTRVTSSLPVYWRVMLMLGDYAVNLGSKPP